MGDPSQELDALEQFIVTKLTGSSGVYTNLIETEQSGEAASGHEILSESASLRMLAAVRSGEKERFAEEWALAKQTFDMKGGFSYRYSPKQQKLYPVNAAVDDLRIIRALYEAGDTFRDKQYTEEAAKYGERFYNYNVKNGYMYDFYDENYKKTNTFVTLCYIDLGTMRKLSVSGESRDFLLNNMSVILKDGYLSDEFPFYETRFNYESGTYSSENINTVESLLSILALAEVDQQKSSSINFIKQQVEAGTLYGQYSREGKPLNDIRSTAIYAITAMIGAEIGDDALYRKSIERMNEFRITDAGSSLYGGFGDVASGQAYSFDNLMAALAYVY
ncbi:hypothetical protein BSK50_01570 [Paenibacillus odorifer]|nr:hypothetical protein BSK50_01570 [Paenibacillus odorifer]